MCCKWLFKCDTPLTSISECCRIIGFRFIKGYVSNVFVVGENYLKERKREKKQVVSYDSVLALIKLWVNILFVSNHKSAFMIYNAHWKCQYMLSSAVHFSVFILPEWFVIFNINFWFIPSIWVFLFISVRTHFRFGLGSISYTPNVCVFSLLTWR